MQLPELVVEISAFVVEPYQASQQAFEVEREQFDKWSDRFPLILVLERVQFVAWPETGLLANFGLKIKEETKCNQVTVLLEQYVNYKVIIIEYYEI